MSGRFPGSDHLEGFWGKRFKKAGSCTRRYDIPAKKNMRGDHLVQALLKIPQFSIWPGNFLRPRWYSENNSTTTRYGCFLDQPRLFNILLFNVSPRETLQMEPSPTTSPDGNLRGYGNGWLQSRRCIVYRHQTCSYVFRSIFRRLARHQRHAGYRYLLYFRRT